MPVTATVRRTCLGSSFDRLLFRTRILVPGDKIERLIEQVVLPDILPGDVILLSSKAVAACQGRLLPLDESRPGKLAGLLASLWRRLSAKAPLAHPAVMQAALEHDGTLALTVCTLSHFWRTARGEPGALPRKGSRGLLRAGTAADLPVYQGQLILPPREPEQLAFLLWQRFGYRVAIFSVKQPGQVQITALSPGLSPEYIRALVLDNPLGQSDQQTPVAILRKRR